MYILGYGMDIDMDLTEKYFNEKFNNVNDNMQNLSDNLEKVVISVDRIDGKVVEHGVRLSLVEGSQKEHLDNHKTKDSKNQFNLSQWVAVFLVIAAILADKIL